MKEKYLRIVYKHYDFAELEVNPKSKFLKSLMIGDKTTKYDFGICYTIPENFSEHDIKSILSSVYNKELKNANFNRKTSAATIRIFNEDFVAFTASQIFKKLGFTYINPNQEEKLNPEEVLTLPLVNPKSKFWKKSQELKDFYLWASIEDETTANKFLNKIKQDEEKTF